MRRAERAGGRAGRPGAGPRPGGRAEPAGVPGPASPPGRPLVVAHRGASDRAPENTLAAFLEAVALRADGVELDVHLTRDGALAVIHDDTLDRTTNGHGPVRACSLQELRGLDAGSWFGGAFAGQRIPTLDEAAAAVPAPLALFVEVKVEEQLDPEARVKLADTVAAALRRPALAGRCAACSFDDTVIRRIKQVAPDVLCGLLWAGPADAAVVSTAEAAGLEALCPHWSLVSAQLAGRCRDRGLALMVWTVDDPAEATRLAALGVDAIITNTPDRILQALS